MWALTIIVFAVVVIAVAALMAVGMANRLNRLHIRTDSARLSLEGALSARAAVIAAVQPELSEQAKAASRVVLKASDMSARSDAENALLTRLDKDVLTHPSFIEAATRVDLAARFYNDAVGATLTLRHRPAVRGLKLAGSAPLPEYYEAMAAGNPR
ncbi:MULTISPECIES: hypothetical protein [unclassified Corynebacterium]|uniref:hypothetical protein n=1 Tax=Corynebacterium TaxID=1716 RepID=UPI00351AA473